MRILCCAASVVLTGAIDGSSDLFGFSTGRRAVSSLHTVFALRPRHDFFQYAYEVLRGFVDLDWKVVDEVELDFTFQDSANVPECIWAVVAKSELKEIKNTRWDLVSAAQVIRVYSLNAPSRASPGPRTTRASLRLSPSCRVRIMCQPVSFHYS